MKRVYIGDLFREALSKMEVDTLLVMEGNSEYLRNLFFKVKKEKQNSQKRFKNVQTSEKLYVVRIR